MLAFVKKSYTDEVALKFKTVNSRMTLLAKKAWNVLLLWVGNCVVITDTAYWGSNIKLQKNVTIYAMSRRLAIIESLMIQNNFWYIVKNTFST